MGMNRKRAIRNILLGGLVTGLAPLGGAGVDAAAAGESPAALCSSTFGENGPVGGQVVGEGPSGDPMSTTIGWDPFDWSDGLSEIVTCVSVSGRAAPALTSTMPTPRNDGSLVVSLTLPPGEPGSLVCEQSVLVGAGGAAGRHRTTSPACFKLRAGESPIGSGAPAPGRPSAPAPAPPAPTAPPGPPAASPKAPAAATARPSYPASTPPARAAFEAARNGMGVPSARHAVPDPLISVAVPAAAWPDPASPNAAAGSRRAPATAAGAAAGVGAAGVGAAGEGAAGAGAPTGAPVSALARTGVDEQMVASAGGFLAIGGAAIIFGAPGRRRTRRPAHRPA
jgi:hypothetical protein